VHHSQLAFLLHDLLIDAIDCALIISHFLVNLVDVVTILYGFLI
jgi:hypothetical protein